MGGHEFRLGATGESVCGSGLTVPEWQVIGYVRFNWVDRWLALWHYRDKNPFHRTHAQGASMIGKAMAVLVDWVQLKERDSRFVILSFQSCDFGQSIKWSPVPAWKAKSKVWDRVKGCWKWFLERAASRFKPEAYEIQIAGFPDLTQKRAQVHLRMVKGTAVPLELRVSVARLRR